MSGLALTTRLDYAALSGAIGVAVIEKNRKLAAASDTTGPVGSRAARKHQSLSNRGYAGGLPVGYLVRRAAPERC